MRLNRLHGHGADGLGQRKNEPATFQLVRHRELPYDAWPFRYYRISEPNYFCTAVGFMSRRTHLELRLHKRNGQQRIDVHGVKETTRLWQFKQTITTWWLQKDNGHYARSTIHSFVNYVNLLSLQSDTRLTAYVHSDSAFTIPTIQQSISPRSDSYKITSVAQFKLPNIE